MPWVRIDEHALNHVKVLALTDGAFRLWVEGLAHCQKHLTDGAIASVALKGFRYINRKRVAELLSTGLWESGSGDGFGVHDYLQWNDGSDVVVKKRTAAKERLDRYRKRVAERVTPPVRNNVHVHVPVVHTPRGREAPLHSSHQGHAICGVVCLPSSLWQQQLTRMGGDEKRLSAWVRGVNAAWQAKVDAGEAVPEGDDFTFWRNRWSESFDKKKPANGEAIRQVDDAEKTAAYLASLRGGQ